MKCTHPNVRSHIFADGQVIQMCPASWLEPFDENDPSKGTQQVYCTKFDEYRKAVLGGKKPIGGTNQ